MNKFWFFFFLEMTQWLCKTWNSFSKWTSHYFWTVVLVMSKQNKPDLNSLNARSYRHQRNWWQFCQFCWPGSVEAVQKLDIKGVFLSSTTEIHLMMNDATVSCCLGCTDSLVSEKVIRFNCEWGCIGEQYWGVSCVGTCLSNDLKDCAVSLHLCFSGC